MQEINLYSHKKDCCGCAACASACKNKAIDMKEDKSGFVYPSINTKKCIGCRVCVNVCAYKKLKKENNILESYAAQNKNRKIAKKSASGGISSAIAESFLKNGGMIAGCAWIKKNSKLQAEHILIDKWEEAYRLQGSKYVQSNTQMIYIKIRKELENGKKILFTGTPCQVAAIKKFIPLQLQEKLYTIDIICHGVPGNRMFQDYLDFLKNKNEIIDFQFRDKTKGWGLNASYTIKGKRRNIKTVIPNNLSSYYTYFLESEIYRESCYYCEYASYHRVGDCTIGDFWGVEEEYPQYLRKNGGLFEEKEGISCILINSEKGKILISDAKNIQKYPADFERIAKWNQQLEHPAVPKNDRREKLLEIYNRNGYKELEKIFQKDQGWKRYGRKLKWKIINCMMRKKNE